MDGILFDKHLTTDEINISLADVLASPKDNGVLKLIVRRPAVNKREVLAGDQLFVDLDLSEDNVPPGTRLSIGEAVIEVTTILHLGCKKFVERFGLDAMTFANSDFGRRHNLRGINAKAVKAGEIHSGNIFRVVSPQE